MLHVTHDSGYDYTRVRIIMPDGKKLELTRFYLGVEPVNSYGTKLVFRVANSVKELLFSEYELTPEDQWFIDELSTLNGDLYISCPIIIRKEDNAYSTAKRVTARGQAIIDIPAIEAKLSIKGEEVTSFCDKCPRKPTRDAICPDYNEEDSLSLNCLSGILLPEGIDMSTLVLDPNKIAIINSTGGLEYVEATSLTGEEVEDYEG